MLRSHARAFILALLASTVAVPAMAQQQQQPSTGPRTPAAQPAPKAAAPKAAPKQAADGAAPAAAPSGGDSQLRQRIEQLEEQLVDMQVVIGTLESLAKSGGGGAAISRPSASGSGPSDPARLDGIEMQIRALTSQLENLSEQVRALGGQGRKADLAPPPPAPQRFAPSPPPVVQPEPRAPGPAFGTTTVTGDPPGGDPIGSLIAGGGPAGAAARAPGSPDDPNPKQLYETAYGYLLQQDYAAAEGAFDDFLKRYPNDSLAGNAQYWLGESHFVRGQFKAAAAAFLKGYQGYGRGAKAPDSLLKLAMSLERLGQKDAACSSYSELSVKFPNAPPHVKSKADSERRRVGCP